MPRTFRPRTIEVRWRSFGCLLPSFLRSEDGHSGVPVSFNCMTNSSSDPALSTKSWWSQLNGFHWFVFIVASLAWFFDCLDQRLFSLARIPALKALMPGTPEGDVQAMGKEVTALFLIGWGIGGLVFGALG